MYNTNFEKDGLESEQKEWWINIVQNMRRFYAEWTLSLY